MSAIIQPFKCQDVLVGLGSSCKQQEEIYNNLYNLQTGVTTLAPNSVAMGSGLGDENWSKALNYEKIESEKSKVIEAEVKKEGDKYVAEVKEENTKKSYITYGIIAIIVAGIIIYEIKRKK